MTCLAGQVFAKVSQIHVPANLVRKSIDAFAFRLLLVVLGLSIGELGIRLAGFRPWFSDAAERARAEYLEQAPTIAWRLRLHRDGAFWSGSARHSETLLEDHTRLVVPTPQSAGAPPVMILGDSAIFGWGLDDDKAFASRLAREFPDHKVINAAVPGYGALQSYLWMKELWPSTQPKVVILGYSDYFLERDVASPGWARVSAEHSITNNYLSTYARLNAGRLEIVPPGNYFTELPGRHAFALVRLVEEVVASLPARSRVKQQVDITKEIFREWSSSVRSKGALPVVLFWNHDSSEELFGDHLRGIGVRVVHCAPATPGDPSMVIPDDGHPSAIAVDSWAECMQAQARDVFEGASH